MTGLVFKSPVAWTGKKTGTGLDGTDLDRTVGCGCAPFRMDEPHTTEPVEPIATVYWMLHENTFKTHLKTSKTVNI